VNTTDAEVVRACQRVLRDVASDQRYAHTSQLLVRVSGRQIFHEHWQGPAAAPVFSVTKSLVATALGAMDAQQLLPDVHSPLGMTIPHLAGHAAADHTWHQVMSMTRGAQADGPWDSDALALLPRGQVSHIAAAPQVTAPGSAFAYDNAGVHLLSAAATAILDEPLADFANRTVFEPIGAELGAWPADPDGITWASEGVEVCAHDLSLIGQLWLDRGRRGSHRIIGEHFFRSMMTPHSQGGRPESWPYGYLVWLPGDMYLAGGWAGQHMLVIPRAAAVVITLGHPRFDLGPPPHDSLPDDWRPALDLVRRHVLPALAG
jgi:CubicO group peptidase (beta-lactamase class C family)